MQLNEQELTNLIARITEEVTAVLSGSMNTPGDETDLNQSEAVVLVSGYVARHKKALERVKTLCGQQARVYLLDEAVFPDSGFATERVDTREQKNALLDKLAKASCVLLIAPSLRQLKNLSQGNDDGYIETAVLKAILWGRDVQILLDFDPPKFKRGSFFETLVDSIDALTGMGVKINTYQAAETESAGKTELVTEDQVMDAYKKGQKTVYTTAGAIITPLAKDKAKELKINIE